MVLLSAELTTSVPSFSTPPCSSSRLMICTRWPAYGATVGLLGVRKYSCSALKRSSSDSTVGRRGNFDCVGITNTDFGHTMLWVVVLVSRSRYEPSFRNLVEKVANGLNRIARLPSTAHGVSRCGTDIGGEPTEAYRRPWPQVLLGDGRKVLGHQERIHRLGILRIPFAFRNA